MENQTPGPTPDDYIGNFENYYFMDQSSVASGARVWTSMIFFEGGRVARVTIRSLLDTLHAIKKK